MQRALLNPTAAQLASLKQVLAESLDSVRLLTTPQATKKRKYLDGKNDFCNLFILSRYFPTASVREWVKSPKHYSDVTSNLAYIEFRDCSSSFQG